MPAHFCGLCGFKPTGRRVSKIGCTEGLGQEVRTQKERKKERKELTGAKRRSKIRWGLWHAACLT